jgi:AAA domain
MMTREEKILLNRAHLAGLGAEVEKLILAKKEKPKGEQPLIYHEYDEMKNAPPVRFVIENFLQADGITLLGALAGHSKTWVMVAMAKALLTGEKLFGHFSVAEKAEKVIYLLPEAAIGPAFKRFCTNFKLDEFIKEKKLLIATLSSNRKITLTDPNVIDYCPNADIFLDTLPRFRPLGAKESEVEGNQVLVDQLLGLINLKTRSITAAQHSPKAFEKEEYMTLENVIRGSGDIGAMASTAWGLRRVTASSDGLRNLVYVENVKSRDFDAPLPFLLTLRPSIDRYADIRMAKEPGKCLSLKEEINALINPDKEAVARRLWNENPGAGRPRLNELVKAELGGGIKNDILAGWMRRWQEEVQPSLEVEDGTKKSPF